MIRIGFISNRGGVGQSTLVYHLAHMMADQGRDVLMVDLDPQADLTAMCLPEHRLETIWPDAPEHPESILGCIRPLLLGAGDPCEPPVETLGERLSLVPGDLGLCAFEDLLAQSWLWAMEGDRAAFKALSACSRLVNSATGACGADTVLIDVGPNLGAINRAALLACDYVVTPLAPDLFSAQGLRNLGPALLDWRRGWADRRSRQPDPERELPGGAMTPLGYVVMQAGMRLSRPVRAYERWVSRIPGLYHGSILKDGAPPSGTDADPACLGLVRHYPSLMPLAQDAQKPMYQLRPADGAIGAHMDAVQRCRADLELLTREILDRTGEI